MVAEIGVLRSGGHVAHAELRRRKAEAQAAQPLARGISQSAVWDAVHERAMDLRVASPTGASSDLYRARAGDLRALEDAFPAQPGQCGAILGIGGDMCLDAVSRPDAFARLWPKLRAGYLLDALDRLGGKPTAVTRSKPSSQTSTTRWCRGSRRSGSARTSACAATG